MSTPADFVLTSEAARILGVSAQSIRQWERLGRLAATKTASGIRLFDRADVEELRRSIEGQRDIAAQVRADTRRTRVGREGKTKEARTTGTRLERLAGDVG